MSGQATLDAGRQSAQAAGPFALTVTAIRDLGPRLRRVTLGGAGLHGFATDDGATWDLRVKLVIPSPGRTLPQPEAFEGYDGAGAALTWRQGWLRIPEAGRGELRSYTVREARLGQASPEIDVDFVLHPGGPQGPAARWAGKLRTGDPALVVGPRAAAGNCQGIEFAPGGARHVLLAGDETALPAIAGILRDLPAGIRAEAFIEVPDVAMVEELPSRATATVTWLQRSGHGHGELLTGAVRRAIPATAGLPDPDARDAGLEEVGPERALLWDTPQYRRLFGAPADGPDADGAPFYAWIAGESSMVTGLRRHLVRECGIHRGNVAFMGYWKQGTPQR